MVYYLRFAEIVRGTTEMSNLFFRPDSRIF